MPDGVSQPVRLTRAQVREVDRRALDQYHIPGIVLMENAARAVTDVAMDRIRCNGRREALILCGGGNNGGDGLAIARHLHNRGVTVSVALYTDPAKYRGDALTNWNIIQAMGLPTRPLTVADILASGAGVVIDAIFGTGLAEAPRPPFADIVHALATAASKVVAVDVPSGLDCDTGRSPGACVRAAATVTFVAEKVGFANPIARQYLGDILVGDIGCPRELIDAVRAG